MKQQLFEKNSRKGWEQLELILREQSENKAELPSLYRQVCHDLALAKQRRYTPSLIENLNSLVMRCHHRLYGKTSRYQYTLAKFVFNEFPRVIRKNATFVYLSIVLFLGPALTYGLLCYYDDDMIYSAMDYSQVQEIEKMYDPQTKKIGRKNESDTDIMMFGFYIKNNGSS